MTPYFRRYFKEDAVKETATGGTGSKMPLPPKLDDFGYATKDETPVKDDKPPEPGSAGYEEKEPVTPVEEKKEPTKVEEKPPVVDPATGYDENEPEGLPTEEVKPPEEKKPDEKPPEELKLNLDGHVPEVLSAPPVPKASVMDKENMDAKMAVVGETPEGGSKSEEAKKNKVTKKGPFKVVATRAGFFGGERKVEGDIFVVATAEELGTWMKLI